MTESDPTLLKDLEALVVPETRGDPMSALRWTCKSTRNLAEELNCASHTVSQQKVGQLLAKLGYTLQSPRKTHEASSRHPDRNAQFEYINARVREWVAGLTAEELRRDTSDIDFGQGTVGGAPLAVVLAGYVQVARVRHATFTGGMADAVTLSHVRTSRHTALGRNVEVTDNPTRLLVPIPIQVDQYLAPLTVDDQPGGRSSDPGGGGAAAEVEVPEI